MQNGDICQRYITALWGQNHQPLDIGTERPLLLRQAHQHRHFITFALLAQGTGTIQCSTNLLRHHIGFQPKTAPPLIQLDIPLRLTVGKAGCHIFNTAKLLHKVAQLSTGGGQQFGITAAQFNR